MTSGPDSTLPRTSRTPQFLTASCFDLCEYAIQALQAQQAERREELRRLVTLVRETVAVVRGDGEAFSSNILQAAGRFNSILQITDVQQLKQRLMVEVDDLQRVATEQQQHWHKAVEGFESRIVALEQQLVAVQQEASLDALTGICNRRAFERAVREVLASPQRELIVAVLDLDEFKAVNDLGGHAAGDTVLRAVARTLRSSVRRNDVVARIGGDEFALLAMGATLRDTEPRIKSIVATLSSIPTGLDVPATVSVSCGIAEVLGRRYAGKPDTPGRSGIVRSEEAGQAPSRREVAAVHSRPPAQKALKRWRLSPDCRREWT